MGNFPSHSPCAWFRKGSYRRSRDRLKHTYQFLKLIEHDAACGSAQVPNPASSFDAIVLVIFLPLQTSSDGEASHGRVKRNGRGWIDMDGRGRGTCPLASRWSGVGGRGAATNRVRPR